MITEEEKQEIINKAVEKALLMLPEVVGNLMANHATMHKTNSEFYKQYPEFASRKDIVASVLEKIDADNPFMKHEDLLQKAVPNIRQRIEMTKGVDMNKPLSVDRSFMHKDLGNGEL
jgi:hypothetical protein